MRSYKSYTLGNYKTITKISKLSADQIDAIEVVGRILPFRVNNYIIDELIDWDNVTNDPIFTLTFPRKEMIPEENYNSLKALLDNNEPKEVIARKIEEIRYSLNPNPAGQEHNVPMLGDTKLKGIQHKYGETVLFFPSQGQSCHAYCTFCFRWPQFSGMSGMKFHMKEADLLHQYLDQNKGVTDVLFTGGDPMTMSAKLLASYIEPLISDRFAHIRTIRIGTKTLGYWPYRYTSDVDATAILDLFKKVVDSGRSLAIQAHFNHYAELSTDVVKEATKNILATGANIRTQSPVLKHINDDSEIWSTMWRKQVDMGMIPYYMFIARDTGSKLFFELPLERCWKIYNDAYKNVSGVCRTVRGPSMSASPGKIHIVGITEVAGEKVFVLSFIQGRVSEWVGIPFFAKYDPAATWFNELKPAFGEEKFFFEK